MAKLLKELIFIAFSCQNLVLGQHVRNSLLKLIHLANFTSLKNNPNIRKLKISLKTEFFIRGILTRKNVQPI